MCSAAGDRRSRTVATPALPARTTHAGAAALLGLLAACAGPRTDPGATGADAAMDIHSAARPAAVRVTHVELDLTADFTARRLDGAVVLDVERADRTAPLRVDTGDDLEIVAVTDAADARPLAHRRAAADPILGRALEIDLGRDTARVRIAYRTAPAARAVQWLAPEQTHGGVAPFLYTQGQAILTRTWIPLQDSPGVRVTYGATIRHPAHLVAVMSAEDRTPGDAGVTRFAMRRPIPPYLIALAIGDLAVRELGDRAAVWAEPGVVGRAAAEFADVPAMIDTCERLYGPYVWGRYDVLVLPPAFPFGGMENPCLTFATPTILAGDGSLVALIAHELAHSWSGNLVTNATWRDFWLNEGFTVYVENRIVEALFGERRAAQETLNALDGLERELAELPPADQVLHVDLTGRDPDDGMTAVPYDKGAAFLRRLEAAFGRERFDAFVAAWFAEHAFRSVTTAEFVVFLRTRLFAVDPAAAATIDVDRWLTAPGLPADAPRPDPDAFAAVDAARARARADGTVDAAAWSEWSTAERLRLLDGLRGALDASAADRLDAALALTGSGNAEILAAWLELRIAAGGPLPPAVDARLEAFLAEVGRRKFLEPIYRALVATPEGRERARAIYARARAGYHAVAQRTLDTIVPRRSD